MKTMKVHPITGRQLLLGDLFIDPRTGTRWVWCGQFGWLKNTKKGA